MPGRCTGSRKTSPTAPGPANRKRRWTSAPSCAEWEQTARDQDLGELAAIPGAVAEAARQARDARPRRPSRTQRHGAVLRVARAIGWEFARQHGRAPDADEFRRIERFARFVTLNGDRHPAGGAGAAPARVGGARARRRAGAVSDPARDRPGAGPLRRAARPGAGAGAGGGATRRQPRGLSEDQARYVMAEAIAVTQARISAWTRADLIRYLGEALPAGVMADRATLETLAARAISGAAGEQVELLSAPEWPRVPDGLRRADGESVFRPHGAERYASQAQLTLEEQLLAQAQEPGAPRLDPAVAARLLGADAERLQAQLQPAADAAAVAGTAGSGLRMDQAAAAWYVLTSPRRAEVMVGPPGTGKTRTAIEMARAWQQAGIGPVVALTASSNARNVLREEAARHGVTGLACYNTAEWLGHAKGAREARAPRRAGPGHPDHPRRSVHDLDHRPGRRPAPRRPARRQDRRDRRPDAAAGRRGRRRHGPARPPPRPRPAERGQPVPHAWERQATLRLRDGDVTVLTDYRQHDRLHVGNGEDILEDAARAYLHDRLQRQGHAADDRDRSPGRRAVPPGPRGPDPVGHRQRRPDRPAPRRRPRLRR